MGFIANFMAGRALTKLINNMEEVARYKKARQDGHVVHGSEQWAARMESDLMENLKPLRKFPRHIVTENLLKNVRIAKSFGDYTRIEAATLVLEFLVEEGVALDLDTFEKSFVR